MKTFLFLSLCAGSLLAQQHPIRVIAFGAHPDDCDIRASGTAALWAAKGIAVKFVALTNGDAGHQIMQREELAARRLAEAKESARRLGIEYEVMNNHDGELLPALEIRKQVIREIREWNADVVLAPRPNDYHPDHRYTGVLVQDAAYMVVVPHLVPEAPALRKNPVFLYFEDNFQRPNPFRPDVVVSIDESFDRKIAALDAHVSQFYEWLPWVDGKLDEVPKDPVQRKAWLARARAGVITPEARATLIKEYGAAKGNAVKHCESFEICEYGTRPDQARIQELFPMIR
jgi:LmbE family N-acetylglucosaminyl deacetylase